VTRHSAAATDLAQRLWDHYAHDATSAAAVAAAADRCFVRLAETLTRWIGVSGYRALLRRAIALDGSDQAALAGLALRDGDERASLEMVAALGAEQIAAAVTGLLATITSLLGRMVGEPVAVRLLEQAEPAGSGALPRAPSSGAQRKNNG
jgi:hypothetical protein